MRFKLVALLVCLIFPTLFSAQENATLRFAEANDLFKQKKYSEAAQVYESILADNQISPELYFNLGNTYSKTNEIGKAVLNLERALQLAPHDPDIVHNLALINASLEDEIEHLSPFFLAAWWQGIRKNLSSGVWSFLGLFFLWLGVFGLILWMFGTSRTYKKWGFTGGAICLLFSILPLTLAFSKTKVEQNSQQAIILVEKIALRNGPDESSSRMNTLHEGTKVQLQDAIGEWVQIRLSNGEIGWLPLVSLEEI